MIRFSIALDSQRKKAGAMRMFHAQINEVTSHANLTFDFKTGPTKNGFDLNLERRVALFAGGLASVNENTALRIFEEQMKVADSLSFAINEDLFAPN